MDKVSRGPRDNGTNGQRVISSTQGQGLLKKNGHFELVSEEGPSCYRVFVDRLTDRLTNI